MISSSSSIILSISSFVTASGEEPTAAILLSNRPITSPSLTSTSSILEVRTANVTEPDLTVESASFMFSIFSAMLISVLKASMADKPCGIFVLCTTYTVFFLTNERDCSAAKIMFLLLGRIMTFSAFILLTASAMSSALGFMV